MDAPEPGGYFSAPHLTLDPCLFDGDTLKPEVRTFITRTIFTAFKDYGLASARRWLHVWVAGSGASYQWGNGDLDILVGADYDRLVRYNSDYAGVDPAAAAAAVNKWLKANVWKMTNSVSFGGSVYEATFYWDAEIGTTIQRIEPYAAYDVMASTWVVRPPQLPHNPAELFDPSWFVAADRDTVMASDFKARFTSASRKFKGATPGTPKYTNAQTEVNTVGAQAKTLFEDIHLGRQAAFAEQGHGYRDYHNFRWQRAKATGTVKALKRIVDVYTGAVDARNAELYGGPITGAQDALRRAELWKSGRGG